MNKKKAYIGNDFYSSSYSNDAWNKQLRREALLLLERISTIAIFSKGKKVLDAGCGSGELGCIIKEKYKSDVYCIELNKQAVIKARRYGLKIKIGDLENTWPYKDSQFDVVTGTEIIEHLVNPDHLLQEANRVLKKNGYLVLTTPNLAAWFNRIILLLGYQPFFTEVSTFDKTMGLSFTRNLTENREPVGHLRCFTLKALRDILELHGYKILLVKGERGYYFPQPIRFFDNIIRYIPSLSANITIVARKIK